MTEALKALKGTQERSVVKLYGSFVTSTDGTIASSYRRGFSVAKTADEVGRYTVTLDETYERLLAVSVSIGSDAADAAYTTGKGLSWVLRNVDVVTLKTLDIQFNSPDGSPADAELEDAATVYIELTLKDD